MIKVFLRYFVLLSLMLTLAVSAEAGKKKSSKKKPRKGQWAFVVVDGAAVYQVPNFDWPILEYLDREKKLRVSRKLYNGIGGLGAFYKVRLGNKRFGYITDVDLRIPGGKYPQPKPAKNGSSGAGNDPFATNLPDDINEVGGPQDGNSIYFTRYLGLAYGSYNYAEEIGGKTESGATEFFGLKLTGPGAFLGGAPMDLEIFYSSGPGFYKDVFSKSSGYLIMFNTLLLLPAMEWQSFLVYYGAGMVMTYSSFQLNTIKQPTNPPLNSEELRAGLAFSLGAALRMGSNWVLRAEGKYFYEEEKYFGFNGGLQYKW